jgi:hypothetical protein
MLGVGVYSHLHDPDYSRVKMKVLMQMLVLVSTASFAMTASAAVPCQTLYKDWLEYKKNHNEEYANIGQVALYQASIKMIYDRDATLNLPRKGDIDDEDARMPLEYVFVGKWLEINSGRRDHLSSDECIYAALKEKYGLKN